MKRRDGCAAEDGMEMRGQNGSDERLRALLQEARGGGDTAEVAIQNLWLEYEIDYDREGGRFE